MAVYLIHFAQPYKHAAHYLGFTPGSTRAAVRRRVGKHRKGTGARLTAVVAEAGIEMVVARVWLDGTRADERRLKRWHKSAQLCPVCRAR